MDWEKLTAEIVAASRISFGDLLKNKNESFYAFILYTDGDCYTVVPAANSLEKYYEKSGNTEDAWYKWGSAEWAYEAWKGDEFTSICAQLSSFCGELPDNDMQSFYDFKKNVHACMINALKRLDEEGFFDSIRNQIVLFISSSDDDDDLEIENKSAKILNSSSVYEKFLKRYDI